ncbi:hypothetical protein EX30DRAFT_131343 [Ascodesmis nigricans]|uniref:Uncharacterized protein n=1 Tax=Ascodesmis nigricans TaxID=341454 RepID=A0A4S2MNW4_9PEZI|nr:hypothetical protein EX30DRAFT_131343 [Ascodesmis nigricans]
MQKKRAWRRTNLSLSSYIAVLPAISGSASRDEDNVHATIPSAHYSRQVSFYCDGCWDYKMGKCLLCLGLEDWMMHTKLLPSCPHWRM